MFNHGVHILSGTAYDLNLNPMQGTTTYVVCPPNTMSCNTGPTYVLPNMDSGLLTDGRINPNLGQINELISPAQNYYNSFFVQLQRPMSRGFSLQASYTFAKSVMLDGMDFNNQFDFSNTHAPSLLDQRHRIHPCRRLPAAVGAIVYDNPGGNIVNTKAVFYSCSYPYIGYIGTGGFTNAPLFVNGPAAISICNPILPVSTRATMLLPPSQTIWTATRASAAARWTSERMNFKIQFQSSPTPGSSNTDCPLTRILIPLTLTAMA